MNTAPGVERPEAPVTVELVGSDADPELVAGLWKQLHRHHDAVAAQLGALGATRDEPSRLRSAEDGWAIRRQQLATWLREPGSVLFLARSAENVLGCCLGRVQPSPSSWDWGEQVGVIELLVVDEAARGQGIGTTLLGRARAWLAELGCRVITVDVIAGNPAEALYQRAGGQPYLRTLALPALGDEPGVPAR